MNRGLEVFRQAYREQAGDHRTEDAMGLVDGADGIVVYGMSLGVNDRLWWRYIASWLLEGRDRMLLLCMYFEPDVIMTEAGPDFIRDTKERFRDVAYMGEC